MTNFKLKLKMGPGLRDADDVAAALVEIAGAVARKVGEDGEFGLIRNPESGEKVGRWDFTDTDTEEFVLNEDDNTGGTYGCNQPFYDEDGDHWFNCSRDKHADPVHAAGNGRRIVAVWSADY